MNLSVLEPEMLAVCFSFSSPFAASSLTHTTGLRNEPRVWLVGDSMVHWADLLAKGRRERNLGLPVRTTWSRKRGITSATLSMQWTHPRQLYHEWEQTLYPMSTVADKASTMFGHSPSNNTLPRPTLLVIFTSFSIAL